MPDESSVLGSGCVCTRASHTVSEIIQLHNPSAGNGANYIRAALLWTENEMKGIDIFNE